MSKIAELLASIKAQMEELEEMLTAQKRKPRVAGKFEDFKELIASNPRISRHEAAEHLGVSLSAIKNYMGICGLLAKRKNAKMEQVFVGFMSKESSRGMSQCEIAKETGMSQATVSKYMRKHNTFPIQLELPLADPTPAQPLPLRIIDMFVDTDEFVTYADIANATGASTDSVRQALDQLRSKLNVSIRFDNKQRCFLLHS